MSEHRIALHCCDRPCEDRDAVILFKYGRPFVGCCGKTVPVVKAFLVLKCANSQFTEINSFERGMMGLCDSVIFASISSAPGARSELWMLEKRSDRV
jgi:hypothetical protein